MKWVICYGGDAMYEESGPVYRVVGPFDSEEEAKKFDLYGDIFVLEDPYTVERR